MFTLRFLPALLSLWGLATPSLAAKTSIAGEWRFANPCDESDETDGQACKDGRSNSFALKLIVQGQRVCGIHASVGRLGGRMDVVDGPEPSMWGHLSKKGAVLNFQSTFGGSGRAELVLTNGVLVWTLLPEVKGENWLPPQAKLQAAAASKWGNSLKKCSGSFTQIGPQ